MIKEELSIVVNETDKIIDFLPRDICHNKKILHRAVHVIILNSNKKIFVQKRSNKKDVFPGFLEASLSGHVIKGETYRKTAIRELKEELNIKINQNRLKIIQKIKINKNKENEIIQVVLLRNIDKIMINKKEVINGRFISLKDLKSEIKYKNYTPATLKILSFSKFK